MDRQIAPHYLRDNFEPSDRLAIVLLDKRNGAVIQRLAATDQIAAQEFQAWLRHKNAQGYEVYVSMNALLPEAVGRTKADIGAVRHIYLDFDEHGTKNVDRLLRRRDLPQPNYCLNSSPGKWQVVWKVEQFTSDQAENLQRALARDTGADPAATDSARVLRLPGFYNHKYDPPHYISVESHGTGGHRPGDFPLFEMEPLRSPIATGTSRVAHGTVSQSERDWAFAKRALARGDARDVVVAAIAAQRQDKHNPQYYAELTVRKAARSLTEQLPDRNSPNQEYSR